MPLTETGGSACLATGSSERNCSSDLASSLFSLVWNELHLQRYQKPIKNHSQAGETSLFSSGHNAECKFSLQSDLLTTLVLSCCPLSAQRHVKEIKIKSPHFAVK